MYRYSNGQLSLADFRQPVGMHLNEENRWVKKAQTIPWPEIEKRYATLFTNRKGNVAEPLRLALGACIIQAEYGYSDEETALQIQKNPHLPQARPNGLSEIRQMPQTYCKDDSQSNREAALLSETGSGSDRKQTCSWKSPDQQASRASAYAPHHLRAAEVHVRQSYTQCSGSHCQHLYFVGCVTRRYKPEVHFAYTDDPSLRIILDRFVAENQKRVQKEVTENE